MLRDKLSSLRDRVGSDGEGEDRRVREAVRRRAPTKEQLRRRARQAGSTLDGGDGLAGPRSSGSHRETARRAEEAAEMADPIGTTLEPADPMNVDDWARGSVGEDSEPVGVALADPNGGGRERDQPDDGLLDFGGGGGDPEGRSDVDDPLEVDDTVHGYDDDDGGWF